MDTGLVMMPRVTYVGSLSSVKDTVDTVYGNISRAYRYCHGSGKPHYPVPAIQRCTMNTTRAYGHNHGPYVFNITLWDGDYIAYAQWSWEQGQEHGTYWRRDGDY